MVGLFTERWQRVCKLDKVIRNGKIHEKVWDGQVWLGKAERQRERRRGIES